MKIDWLKTTREKYTEYDWKQIFRAGSKNDMTVGEDRIRTEFNPSKISSVDTIKQYSARLIDLCEELKEKDTRLASLAQTYYEIGAILATKAATSETPTD